MVLQEDPEFPALTLMKIPAALIVSTASSGRKKSEWPPKKKKKGCDQHCNQTYPQKIHHRCNLQR